MTAPFRSVDSLEIEGDAREAYADWMAAMADVAIVDVEFKDGDLEEELLIAF